MSLDSFLFALLGAALVAIGALAAALADRIRGLHVSREPLQRPAPRKTTPAPIEVIEPESCRTSAERVLMSKDVIAALVGAGYKRSAAAAAVDACTSAERATIEDWTRAALRRAGGGAS